MLYKITQLLQSGTAIGALVREAEQVESKADFLHQLAIALKQLSTVNCQLSTVNLLPSVRIRLLRLSKTRYNLQFSSRHP
jgi:four helix bundle protein